jgi:hypothetical protein
VFFRRHHSDFAVRQCLLQTAAIADVFDRIARFDKACSRTISVALIFAWAANSCAGFLNSLWSLQTVGDFLRRLRRRLNNRDDFSS